LGTGLVVSVVEVIGKFRQDDGAAMVAGLWWRRKGRTESDTRCDDIDVASSSTGKFTVTVRYNDEIVAQFIRQAGQWLSYYTVLSFAW